MASDGMCADDQPFHGFSLSLTLPTEAEVDRVFAALAEGGEVRMPLEQNVLVGTLRHGCGPLRVGWMLTLPI